MSPVLALVDVGRFVAGAVIFGAVRIAALALVQVLFRSLVEQDRRSGER